MNRPLLSVVVPAFNEEQRLEKCLRSLHSYCRSENIPVEILVVDDGSSDGTATVAETTSRTIPEVPIRLLRNERNLGKGASVRRGMIEAGGEYSLLTDADLSTPIEEFGKLFQALSSNQAQIAIGSRGVPGSDVQVRQSNVRENSGALFNFLVRLLFRLPLRDTQCGFKIFQTDPCRDLWRRQTVGRFSFDVEILLMAREAGLRIVEVPVVWRHDRGSRVRFVKDGSKMILDLGRIALRYWLGGYRPRNSGKELG